MSNNDNEFKRLKSRRQVLRAGVGMTALGLVNPTLLAHAASIFGSNSSSVTYDDTSTTQSLPDPALSGIDHVVLVVMENRSFDHMLGWVSGANGKQSGLTYTDAFGNSRSTFQLTAAADYGFQSCGHSDPDHTYVGGRTHYNNGKCDGFLLTPDTNKTEGDLFPIGYFVKDDLAFYAGCADNWTICDNYMTGILGPTYPNRFYYLTGQTDRIENDLTLSQLPTVFDRFNAKGLSAKYYYSDFPFVALCGAGPLGNSFPFTSFLDDASSGNLPAFSFIDPAFVGEGNGTSTDDHPAADVRNGQVFLNRIYDALRASPNWERTLLVITYDEWGGFYDHVAPIVRPTSFYEKELGNDGRLGFRVPFIMAGPRVKRRFISSRQLDPSSLHKFLMWRFGIDSLGVRSTDSSTNSIAALLDFKNPPNLSAPKFNVPQGRFGGDCNITTALEQADQALGDGDDHWEKLGAIAQKLGYKVY